MSPADLDARRRRAILAALGRRRALAEARELEDERLDQIDRDEAEEARRLADLDLDLDR